MDFRRQIITSNVGPRAERLKIKLVGCNLLLVYSRNHLNTADINVLWNSL